MRRKESAAILAMEEELKRAARELGMEVREEELLREVGYRPRSGVCRVREREVILLDRQLPAAERVEVLCAALAGRDLERVFLSPAARARLAAVRPATAGG
jgi:hypothetical protein